MSDVDKLMSELEAQGYESFRISSPHGEGIVINYEISTGKREGEKVLLGFAFQEGNYPEYPPHWIFISPPYSDGKSDNGIFTHADNQGVEQEWRMLSRPPSDFWDRLPTKHMKAYLDVHITRFCSELQ